MCCVPLGCPALGPPYVKHKLFIRSDLGSLGARVGQHDAYMALCCCMIILQCTLRVYIQCVLVSPRGTRGTYYSACLGVTLDSLPFASLTGWCIGRDDNACLLRILSICSIRMLFKWVPLQYYLHVQTLDEWTHPSCPTSFAGIQHCHGVLGSHFGSCILLRYFYSSGDES